MTSGRILRQVAAASGERLEVAATTGVAAVLVAAALLRARTPARPRLSTAVT